MKLIADGVYLLRGFPPDAYNVYVIRSGERWILVDTATRHAAKRIARQLPGELEAIFVTHAHQDHAGSMHVLAQRGGTPVWGPERDADALEGRAPRPLPTDTALGNAVNRLFADGWRDPHPVTRRLNEGDAVGEFQTIAFPGHTPGQLGLWRERDRTVICADTMRSMNFATGLPQLGEMPKIFTCDVDEARRSIRKLAALRPDTVCFGHGRPLAGAAAEKIAAFAASLPADAAAPRSAQQPEHAAAH